MDVVLKMQGWADSFVMHKKVEFAIQCALFQKTQSCDWDIHTTVVGPPDCRAPHSFRVSARRVKTVDHKKGEEPTPGYRVINFNFTTRRYTLDEVYSGALKALEGVK